MRSTRETAIAQEFRQAVIAHLQPLTGDLIKVLRQLIGHNYPKEVFVISFEIFSDDFTHRFPVHTRFMDADNNEYFIFDERGRGKYPAPEGFDAGLLNVGRVYPEGLEQQFQDREPTLDPWDLATRGLVEWFSKCWLEAGGKQFERHAVIGNHDDTSEFNLMTQTWQEAYSLYGQG